MIHPPAGQAQSLSGGIAKGYPTEEDCAFSLILGVVT